MSNHNINQERSYFNLSKNDDIYYGMKYNRQSMPLLKNYNYNQHQSEGQTIQRLKYNMNKYNNELLLPKCMQKSLTRKFALQPLLMRGEKVIGNSQEFRLRNYRIKPVNQYDCPQELQQQAHTNNITNRLNNNNNSNESISQLMNTTAQFSKFHSTTSSKLFRHKSNPSFQDEVSDMLLNQSKIKYQPKNKLKIHKFMSKRSLNFSLANQSNQYGDNDRCSITKVATDLNKSKSQISLRTIFTAKGSFRNGQNCELLNGTRTKLLSNLNQLPQNNLTKADLFPLERLLEKKNRKLNFRNKWFNQNTTIQL